MRRLLALFAVALCTPLAVARAEDETKTYDLHTWRAVWKVGDTATVTSDDASPGVMKTTAPDPKTGKEATRTEEQRTQVVATYVLQCLEADDEGRGTRFLVHMSDWKHTSQVKLNGKETVSGPDASLKGLHLEVAVAHGVRSVKILTPDAKPSKAAFEWLENNLGPRQSSAWVLDLDVLGRPGGPVKVGDSWQGDPTKMRFALPLNAEASKVDLKLSSVTDGAMRLAVAIRFKADGFPAGQVVLPFTQGGVFESDYVVTHSLAPRTFDSKQTVLGGFQGVASQPGVKIEMEFGSTSETVTRTGGEMPKPPGEKPADAPK